MPDAIDARGGRIICARPSLRRRISTVPRSPSCLLSQKTTVACTVTAHAVCAHRPCKPGWRRQTACSGARKDTSCFLSKVARTTKTDFRGGIRASDVSDTSIHSLESLEVGAEVPEVYGGPELEDTQDQELQDVGDVD